MIEKVLDIQRQISDLKEELRNELKILGASGHAKLQSWDDKYGFYATYLISDDAELLKDAEIDGWISTSCNPIVLRSTGKELPKDDPRIITIDREDT